MATEYETIFDEEPKFEEALVSKLINDYGWKDNILTYPTGEDLVKNWENIIFRNNKEKDVLNGEPLTDGEMSQIISHFNGRSPFSINQELVTDGTVSIKRDNQQDKLHFNKEVSLFLFNPREIKGGRSVYQIARQPQFKKKDDMARDRRGDIMLLINGMPLYHIEVKRSSVDIENAEAQIKKYHKENVYTGIFSLVQIFVAMNPNETVYFANPGSYDRFNSNYFFHWADFENNRINNWAEIARNFLSIPMAHQLIGYYTVADSAEGILKVMRSYQIYAAQRIIDRVRKALWTKRDNLGGYVAACTGSGKTMTSYKSAQLIRDLRLADKVVFLMDRVELGNQSTLEYKNFADDEDEINVTKNTNLLISKLQSSEADKTLIVSSIQKMSRVNEDAVNRAKDLETIQKKRIVFIIDECHRSTFGIMLQDIKKVFPNALFFGFTGTPIMAENAKKNTVTSDLFGNELHLYSIADGIRDKNIIGFDTYRMLTFDEADLRKQIGLEKAKAPSIEEVQKDEKKKDVFLYYTSDCPMLELEKMLSSSQYETDTHREAVVDDIVNGWDVKSQFKTFSAILATSSIPEAIEYYRLLQSKAPQIKVTALFDASDDGDFGIEKNDAIKEILTDYNARYSQIFAVADYGGTFKKDVSTRLAHKDVYLDIHKHPEKRIDLLIVVNQMLTGFDSKYLNALYLDKILEYEQIIQAFSRTNRLFGPSKKFGIIKYYRKPETMAVNIEEAVKLYSKDRRLSIFVDKLPQNIMNINTLYQEIINIFKDAQIEHFQTLPEDKPTRRKFAKLFKEITDTIDAAKIQGFSWDIKVYRADDGTEVELLLDENTNDILLARYKDLFRRGDSGGGDFDVPYDVDGYITERDTEKIDADYMNQKFKKYVRVLDEGDANLIKEALEELHRSYATLSEEDQKYAELFLHDIVSHSIQMKDGMCFKDYVNEYKAKAKNDQIHHFAELFGVDEAELRNIMSRRPDEESINKYGLYDKVRATADKNLVKKYYKARDVTITPPRIATQFDKLLRGFILEGGFEIA